MKKYNLTVTIKTTTPEASERLFKALATMLTSDEKAAVLQQLADEIAKLEKAKKKRR
jgi:hypothetical protein